MKLHKELPNMTLGDKQKLCEWVAEAPIWGRGFRLRVAVVAVQSGLFPGKLYEWVKHGGNQ